MPKTGGTPTTSFKIWKIPEDADDGRTLAHGNPEIDEWRSRVDEHPVACSTEKQQPKMTKFPRRCVSKETHPAAENPKKTPENLKIPVDSPKAPLKPRRAANKRDGVPKRLEFPEAEDENAQLIDSGFVATQASVTHRYPTRARVSGRATQNRDENPPKIANARTAEPKRNSHNLRDCDKENDASAANSAEPRQETSLNKKRTGPPVNRPRLQNLAIPDVLELNSTGNQLSECSSDDYIEHMRWLQKRRDIGLWIECCRKGCGKWRYVEEYHDPLDVPNEWFCEMNTAARFADCSIPEAEIPEAEVANQIENSYNAGSIVWAKVDGYPWWPAMVDDCPRLLRYFEIRGSSIVPYKYHVKFFNEMKVAWILVRSLKPYAENPRTTFLKRKKIVFRRKDYTEEVNAACELTDQALSLPLRQRLEKFSWVASQFSSPREGEDLRTKEVPPKKKTSTRKSSDDANKRHAKKNRTEIANKTVSKQTTNVRSRTIDVVNREPSSPQCIFDMRITLERRRTASGSKSPGTESANSESCNKKRLYNIGGKTSEQSDVDAMPRRDLINLMCGCEDQSLTEDLTTSQSGDVNKATRFDVGSKPNVFAGTKEPAAASWEPIEIDPTDDSSDYEYLGTQEASTFSSSSIRRDSESHGQRFDDGSDDNISVGTDKPSALTRNLIFIDFSDADFLDYSESCSFRRHSDSFSEGFVSGSPVNISVGTVDLSAGRQEYLDHPSHLESRSTSNFLPNLTLASVLKELDSLNIVKRSRSRDSDESSESIVPSSQPEQDELYQRLPKFHGLCLGFRHSNVSGHPSPVKTDRYCPAHSSSMNL